MSKKKSKDQTLKHLAIIMDGNRRWAKANNLPKLEGHRRGYNKAKEVVDWCLEEGIAILTVYAFSTENWNRQPEEVNYLMGLLYQALTKDVEKYKNKGVRIKVIGQIERLSLKLQEQIKKIEAETKSNNKLLFQLSISYGGRAEIVQAVQKIIKQAVSADRVTEQLIADNLWTAGVPEPDLIMRTSGEQRLSNFLLWQGTYAEIYFTPVHWPAFSRDDFNKALEFFHQRQRRFGGDD